MPDRLELHKSFRDNIGKLSTAAVDEIGTILRALEGDPSYYPDGPEYADYQIERDPNGLRTCSHIEIWGYWQLMWYSMVNLNDRYVVVRLEELSVQPLKPTRNSL
jgi:hypothetical protein